MQRLQGCVVIFPRYDAIFALKRGKNAMNESGWKILTLARCKAGLIFVE